MDPKSIKRSRKHSKSLEKPKVLPENLPPQAFSEDDSEDEEILIKTGKVPRKWYEDYKHLGYDISANAVLKKEQGC